MKMDRSEDADGKFWRLLDNRTTEENKHGNQQRQTRELLLV